MNIDRLVELTFYSSVNTTKVMLSGEELSPFYNPAIIF